jgi:hypothetical protein
MSSEQIEQPAWDAPQVDWRRFGGQIRQRVGSLRKELLEIREAHVGLREKHTELERRHERLRQSKRRDARMLTALERDLQAGDIPAAVDRLAGRRALIEADAERNARST